MRIHSSGKGGNLCFLALGCIFTIAAEGSSVSSSFERPRGGIIKGNEGVGEP
jgi:hypothetical protein